MMKASVEFTAKYVTTVEDLSEAWVFVMDHIDQVGPDPTIIINPKWRITDPVEERYFEVVVSGMVE